MKIAIATEADLDAVLSVELAAFARDEEPRLVADLLRDPTAQPTLSLLAYQSNQPVGHILFTKAEVTGSPLNITCALLAPLAVIPAHQRQGVGRTLIEKGASLLAASGVKLLFVLGHPQYYTRCDFVPAIPLGLHAPYTIVPEEAWMVRPLAPGFLGSIKGTVTCASSLARPEYWRE